MAQARLAFTFHRCLGEGGYGEVYLATQHTEGGITRDVAVKVLHQRFDDGSDAVKRLRDEGQALALLAHPCILSVHEFARVDGRLALVTEYVEGVDLSYFCVPDRPLPEKVALQVMRDVAEALAFALTTSNPLTGRPLELIHRDVKPANIRLSVDGKVKLLDFGVARSREIDRQAKTAMGDVLLTPGYGSPEALAFGVSGPSVDVFALAASAYEMFTGKPFYGVTDLQYQLSLALDSEDYTAHLEKRLVDVEDEGIRTLLRDMMGFAHETRLTAADAADRADELWQQAAGPSLGKWSRTTAFPDESTTNGALCGRRIDAEGVIDAKSGPKARPSEGKARPSEGKARPSEAKARPSEAKARPTNGRHSPRVVEGPTESTRRPRPRPAASTPPDPTGLGKSLELTHPPPNPRVATAITPITKASIRSGATDSLRQISAEPSGRRWPLVLAGLALLLGGGMFVIGVLALVGAFFLF